MDFPCCCDVFTRIFSACNGVYCDNNPESETKHFPECADERADGRQTQEQEQIRLPVSPAAGMWLFQTSRSLMTEAAGHADHTRPDLFHVF